MGSIRRASQWGVVLAGLLLSGCSTLPKTSLDYGDVTRRMDVIAVMPATFTLSEVGAFSSQQASELTHDIEIEVRAAVETIVGKSRYKCATFDVSDHALATDAELRTALFEQNQAMAEVFRKLSDTRSKKIDVDYSGNVDLLADRAGADYLLFVRGGGMFMTSGAQVKAAILAVLVGGGANSDTQTDLAGVLVDARTKKIVWYNVKSIEGKDPRKPSHLLASAQKLTAPLLGKVRIEEDDSRDEVIIDKYKAMKKETAGDR